MGGCRWGAGCSQGPSCVTAQGGVLTQQQASDVTASTKSSWDLCSCHMCYTRATHAATQKLVDPVLAASVTQLLPLPSLGPCGRELRAQRRIQYVRRKKYCLPAT